MDKNRGRTLRQKCGRTSVRTLLLVWLALAMSLGLVSARWVAAHAAGGSPAQVSHAQCSPVVKWAPSPNPGWVFSYLNGIAAVSASNIWAVGNSKFPIVRRETLIEHWNGSSWGVVPSLSPGSASNSLRGIAAVSTNENWAVGGFANTTGPSQTLIEHWNGFSWSVVPSPSPGSFDNGLNGIAAVSRSNIWAVGEFDLQTLIEHWNGLSWSVVPSPSPGSARNFLNGIAAVSANDIWAVGGFANTTSLSQTLIEHWNGLSWSVVPSPNPGSSENELHAIAAVSPVILWTVGNLDDQTLIEIIKVC